VRQKIWTEIVMLEDGAFAQQKNVQIQAFVFTENDIPVNSASLAETKNFQLLGIPTASFIIDFLLRSLK